MFNAEAVTAPEASIAFQLRRERGASYPFGCSLEVSFSADPGAFEIDIQMADLDVDSHYVTENVIAGGLNASFVGRLDLPIFWAKYIRAYVKTLTNPVNVTLLLTR